jgi:hypothetical protein
MVIASGADRFNLKRLRVVTMLIANGAVTAIHAGHVFA